MQKDNLCKGSAPDKEMEGTVLFPVQVQVQCPEEDTKRTLTWEEMHKAMKKVHAREKRHWWMKHRFILEKERKSNKARAERKRMKRQEEHPEQILAKKEFWVIKT